MKTYMILLLILIGPVFTVRSRSENTDRIFFTNGEIHSVVVKQVTPETITYHFVGEELKNVITKTDVEKIIFKSGREQNFMGSVNPDKNSISADFEYLR